MSNDERDTFCEHCDVVLDLHAIGGEEPWDCENAIRKAEIMADFFSIFRRH